MNSVLETKGAQFPGVVKTLKGNAVIQSKWTELAVNLGLEHYDISKLNQDLLLDKKEFGFVIHELLILWTGRFGSEAKLTKLISAVEKCGAGGAGETLRLDFDLPCRECEGPEPISWDKLSPAFQDKVLVELELLLGRKSEAKQIANNLDPETLLCLMTRQAPAIFLETVPEQLSYYISRTLTTRKYISKKIFKDKAGAPDIFVFSGMSSYELSKLAEERMTSGSSAQLAHLTVNFIALENPAHFQQICAKAQPTPVHWLNNDNGKLNWVTSAGKMAMATLQKFVSKHQKNVTESNFLLETETTENSNESPSLPVIITDSPGMGKSVFLAQIEKHLLQRYPKRLVVFFVISEFVKSFRKTGNYNPESFHEGVESLLEDLGGKNLLGKALFRRKLRDKTGSIQIELLFDGFDEVNSTDVELTLQLLKFIRDSYPSIRMWITSRPHFLHQLENTLSVLGYNLRPFTKQDQINFLVKYWSLSGSKSNILPSKLEQFGNHCLGNLEASMRSKDYEIAGVPLQCLLVADVFQDEALGFADSCLVDKPQNPFPPSSNTITCFVELYQLLIRNRLTKYYSEAFTSETEKLAEGAILNFHVRLSLGLIFPQRSGNLLQVSNPEFAPQLEEILKVGILESRSTLSNPRFIHRTFAEYFIAWMMYDRMLTSGGVLWDEQMSNFLLTNLARSEASHESYVCSYFLNALLSPKQFVPIHSSIFMKMFDSLDSMSLVASSCARNDFFNIFNLFDEKKALLSYSERIFNREFLLLTVRHSSMEFVKLAFLRLEQHLRAELPSEILIDALRASAKRGNFFLFQFLLKEKQLRSIVSKLPIEVREIVHDCVRNTKDNSERELRNRSDILRTLADISKALLNFRDEERKVPILSDYVHISLILFLIDLEADVLLRDRKGDGVLHLNSCGKEHLTKQDFHRMATKLSEFQLRAMLNMKGDDGQDPVKRLLSFMDPEPETLELFKNVGDNIDKIDGLGRLSTLALAISKGRNRHTIRKLIELGANLDWQGNQGETLLHLAASFGNAEAVDVLLKEAKGAFVNINGEDSNGLTPMDHLLRTNLATKAKFEIGVRLHSLGGKFQNDRDTKGRSLLHMAALDNNLQSARLLLHFGLDVNAVDGKGNTPLHLALSSFKEKSEGPLSEMEFHMIHLLLSNGADPNLRNQQGLTPLSLGLIERRGHLDRNSFILLQSKTSFTSCSQEIPFKVLETLDFHGDFQLCKDIVEYAIILGGNVSTKDGEGQTFLHRLFNADKKRPDSEAIFALCEFLARKESIHLWNEPSGDSIATTPLQLALQNAEIDIQSLNFIHSSCEASVFNFGDTNGNTALHYTITGRRPLGILKRLVELDADWGHMNKQSRTLVHVSATEANFEALKYFVDLGLDINLTDVGGNTALHLASAKILSDGQLQTELEQVVKFLLEKGADPFAPNGEQLTALAIRQKCLEETGSRSTDGVTELLKLGADLNRVDEAGNTLLHLAAYEGNLERLRYLIRSGVNPALKNHRGQTPLHSAVYCKKRQVFLEVVKALVETEGLDLNAKDHSNLTFLHALSTQDTVTPSLFHRIAEYLLIERKCLGALFNEPGYNTGGSLTPIHSAVIKWDLAEDTLALLKAHGVNLNAQTSSGGSVLFSAVMGKQSIRMLESLVKLGADPRHRDAENSTVLHYAAYLGSTEALKFFLELKLPHGSELKDMVNLTKNSGHTALHTVFMADTLCILEKAELLLEHGADVDQWSEKEQVTPFMMILARKDVFFQEQLLRLAVKKVDLTRRFTGGDSHLHYSAAWGNIPAARMLLELRGMNVNIRNDYEETPLHRATESEDKNGSLPMIKFLIDKGADPFALDDMKVTFLQKLLDPPTEVIKPSMFHELIAFLLERNLGQLLNERGPGQYESTLFQKAVTALDTIEERTLELLRDSKVVNINALTTYGDSVLFLTVQNQKPMNIIQKLVEMGADLTHVNFVGSNLLHHSVSWKRLDCLEYFLGLGKADVNGRQPETGFTPLQLVANGVDHTELREMMQAMVDTGGTLSLLTRAGLESMTVGEVKKRPEGIYRALESRTRQKPEAREEQGQFAEKAIRLLVRYGADLNSKTKNSGETPLITAAGQLDREAAWKLIKCLVELGADTSLVDKEGLTFLQRFLADRETTPLEFDDIVNFFVGKGLAHLFQFPEDTTAFHTAMCTLLPQKRTLETLKGAGVDLDHVDDEGNSGLFYVIEEHKSRDCVELLTNLIELGADWKRRVNGGNSVVHAAAVAGNLEALKFFMAKGEFDINDANEAGQTPLELTAEIKDERVKREVVAWLKENGAVGSACSKRKRSSESSND